MEAVRTGNFEQTRIAYHPGVTTMWIAGLRQFLAGESGTDPLKEIRLARGLIGAVIFGGLVAAFFLLYRLFSFLPATFAWAFLAVNPFFLAQSRRVHTDALATIFILLTVLLFLYSYVSAQQRRYLILSGVAFGLACLSKSYSLIVLLWLPVCLLLFREPTHTWQQFFSHAFLSILLFLNCSLLTVFSLWPIFWNPAGMLFGMCLLAITVFLPRALLEDRHAHLFLGIAAFVCFVCAGYLVKEVFLVFDKVAWAVTTAHEVEHFFLGKIIADPGWLFYLLTLSMKSTPFLLPLAIVSVIFLWRQRQHPHMKQHFKIAIAIGTVVILFTMCLSFTSKKFARYLLPAFSMLDVLAGMGLLYAVKWMDALFKKQYFRKVAQVACVVLVILLTAVPIFALHPYYGAYYNLCWKVTDITKIITVGDASGLDLAAKYFEEKDDVRQLRVAVSPLSIEFFQYYFVGFAYNAQKKYLPADYEVVYIRDSQIGRVPQTGTRNGKLEHTIILNGIDHVWIYRVR